MTLITILYIHTLKLQPFWYVILTQMTHWYLLALADGTVGMGWIGSTGISTFHTTWSTCLQVPKHSTLAQYQFPKYCCPYFMSSPATLAGILLTSITRSVTITILRAVHDCHINLV